MSYRYSAPQSPIEVIIVRLLECFKIASIALLSCIVRWNPYTPWFSSGCSERPRRAPTWRNKFRLRKKNVSIITNDDSTNKWMIQHPTCRNVGDALPMPISYDTQNRQKWLKQFPGAPCLYNHVEILGHWKRSKPRLDKSKNQNVHLPLRRREIACIRIGFRSSQPLVSQKATALWKHSVNQRDRINLQKSSELTKVP